MSPSPDVLERLAAADPVDPDAPVPPVELARIEALVRPRRSSAARVRGWCVSPWPGPPSSS